MYSLYHGQYDGGGAMSGAIPTYDHAMMAYWERSLFQRMTALVDFDGLPEAWDKDAFRYGLYRRGFLAMFESKTYGRVFQPATPCYMGLYYQPTAFQIATPFFNFSRPLKRGVECEVLKLTPDYRGVWDIVTKYAAELARQEVAIRQSQLNARFAYAAVAENENAAATLKTIFEKLANGETAVVMDKRLQKSRKPGSDDLALPWQQFDRDLKRNFLLPELLDTRREILTDFYREMGIRVAPDKRERIGSHEAESYDAETFARLLVYDTSLQDSLERVNAFLGTNITFKIQGRGEDNVTDTLTQST